jgi:hypothetical protein
MIPGSSYVGAFTLNNPSTGQGQNADSLPLAMALHDAVFDPAVVLTVASTGVGQYVVTGTIPSTYSPGDWVTIVVTSTVAGVTASEILASFQLTGPITVPSSPTVGPASPPPEVLGQVYCTDEDLAVRASGDFGVLCPDWQRTAYAVDGAFDPADLWTLTSPSTDFGGAGVQPRQVIDLQKPVTTFRGGHALLGVDSVNGTSITLHRLGSSSSVGAPPSPIGGLTGVQFSINTLGPQIEEESFILNRRYNIDPTIPSRRPTDMSDMRELRYACVLGTLYKRYSAETRNDREDFAFKAKSIYQELTEVYARLEIRWASAVIGQDKTNWFSTRIER